MERHDAPGGLDEAVRKEDKMKIIEHKNDYGYLTTEYDQELLCPFTRDACLASKCAMSVFIENHEYTTHYCGLIANKYNTAWNESGCHTPYAPWTLEIASKKLCDNENGGDRHGS